MFPLPLNTAPQRLRQALLSGFAPASERHGED